MAKQALTWLITSCLVFFTIGPSPISHAQSPQKPLRLELQLAGIRLGSPVIDRDENGNLKPNCLLRVWGVPDLLITPAIQIRIRQLQQQIRRLRAKIAVILDIIAREKITVDEEVLRLLNLIGRPNLTEVSLFELGTILLEVESEVLKRVEAKEGDRSEILRKMLKETILKLIATQNELQEARQIAKVGSELIWTLMVNIPPAESLEGITQYVWIYKRGEAAMAFLEQDGIVIAIAIAGYDFPYARTALGDPFRSIKLGDDLQRVLLRYGPPDEIQFVGTPSMIPLISPMSQGAIHNMLILRYHKTSNIEFLILNNKVVRIFIFLPEPERFHSLKRGE